MAAQITKAKIQNKSMSSEQTFVTKGAENPTVNCENW